MRSGRRAARWVWVYIYNYTLCDLLCASVSDLFLTHIVHTHSQLNVLIHYHRLFRVSIKTFLLLLVTIQRQYDLSTKVNAPRVQEAEAEEDIDDDDDTSSHQTNAPLQEEWVRVVAI